MSCYFSDLQLGVASPLMYALLHEHIACTNMNLEGVIINSVQQSCEHALYVTLLFNKLMESQQLSKENC